MRPWFIALIFAILIGASLQAPKPFRHFDEELLKDDEDNEYTRTNQVEDVTPSDSSIVQDDLAGDESTDDELKENEQSDDENDSVSSYIKNSPKSDKQQSPTHTESGDSVASYISGDKFDEKESSENDDSVSSYIKSNTAQDTLSSLSESKNTDSVGSYISSGDKGDKRPAKNDDNDDDDANSKQTKDKAIADDSVASYIGTNHGSPKDSIPKGIIHVKDAFAVDSVADYIDINQGFPKNTIPKGAKKYSEGDSVASYIEVEDGSPKHTIINEPIAPSTKMDSVGSYINMLDKPDIKISDTVSHASGTGSGESLKSSGGSESDDQKTHKTQEILKGLENLTMEKMANKKHSRMDDLSPDAIKPHKMVAESWLKKSAFSGQQTDSEAQDEEEDHYSDQMMPYPYQYQPQYTYVNLTQSQEKGAVCLDGSTPGFFYRQGVGNGQKKWIIYLQGGAWCHSKIDCYNRSKTGLGSSLKFNTLVNVEGLLSRDPNENENFYEWNVAYVPYCDGASYTGNRTKPIKVKDKYIFFRGKRILSSLMDDLLGYGMDQAEQVIFSGTSAGGLAVLVNSDYVRQRIPSNVKVYSLSDAGVFVNVENMKKRSDFGGMMAKVYKLHKSYKSINKKCKKHEGKGNGWKCLFPYYFGKYINSSTFIINPLYDSWQLGNVVGIHCTSNLNKCSTKELHAIVEFRNRTLEALGPLISNPKISLFADGCFDHGQITFSPKWNQIRVKNRSMSGTFFRWMMDEENIRAIVDPDSMDELFNPTCVTHQYKISKKSILSHL